MPNFDNPRNRTDRQRLDRAVPFRLDDNYEHLLHLRDTQPDAFAALPPSAHIGLGLYEADKANHDNITGSN